MTTFCGVPLHPDLKGSPRMPKSAILVIDVQIGLVTGAHAESTVIKAINRTISKVRESSGVVVFIQHCHSSFEPLMKGNAGWRLHPDLNRSPEDLLIEKEASDSFYETQLDDLLTDNGVDHVYVTGLQTEFCVDTTSRAALSRGYSVTLVSDGHTTGDSHIPAEAVIDHHNKVLANLAHPKSRIRVISSEEL
jgi:nicotinamidase-related amidase